MPPAPVRLVCFDLGGVLVRLARDWPDACRRAGVELPHVSDADSDRHRALMRRYETGRIDDATYLREACGCVAGGVVVADQLVRVFDAWLLGMYDGAAELLSDLKARGVMTACLSNTNARHWDALTGRDEYRPLRLLDHRLASHELGVMKPDEQAYRRAEAATGSGGGEVLFFDDKPENVIAARAVGWRAEVIDRADDAVPQVREFLVAHAVL
jgi:HAD superfamily hydrolase (TIGR01509 family)